MTNRFIIGFFAFILAFGFFEARASGFTEIDLAEENDQQPVLCIMYEGSEYKFKQTDCRPSCSAFLGDNEKNLFNVKGRNTVVFKLKARKGIEFVNSKKKYTANEDDFVLFAVFLGASGSLSTHFNEILLPKDYYWHGRKVKTGPENTMTILDALQQWADRIKVDNIDTFTQENLCKAIEEKLRE